LPNRGLSLDALVRVKPFSSTPKKMKAKLLDSVDDARTVI
jgi:hypothetical protein